MERLHIVIWDDTFGVPAGWQFEEDIERTTNRVHSVGRLICSNEESFTLAPHLGGNNQEGNNTPGI